MTRPTFTCRNTLERLRESYDGRQRKEENTNSIKIVRVEYAVSITGEDGKTVSVNKVCTLSNMDSIASEHIQQVLEQEVQAAEEPALENNIAGSYLVVTKITELKPTGDDDQM